MHTETPVPLCVHTAQLPDRGHVALTHAALGWEGQLAPLLWLPPPGAAVPLVAALRQDSGLAYSEYGAALALFVETQHSTAHTFYKLQCKMPHT